MTKAEIYSELTKIVNECPEDLTAHSMLVSLMNRMRMEVVRSQKNVNAKDCTKVIQSMLVGSSLPYDYTKLKDNKIVFMTPHIIVVCKNELPSDIDLSLYEEAKNAPYLQLQHIINRDYAEPGVVRECTDPLLGVLTELKLRQRKGKTVVRKFNCGLVMNCILYRYAMILTEAEDLYAPKKDGKFKEPVAFLGKDYDAFVMPMSPISVKDRQPGFIEY